jgi:large subunit ribosomal protein L21
MYAIVTIAGQQFKVEKGKKVIVHQLHSNVGDEVTFEKVLLIDNEGKIKVGTPYVKDAAVTAQVVSHMRGDKIRVFKKKRRKGYQVLNGHRQYLTELLIDDIIESGFVKKEHKPKKAEEPKVVDKVKAEPKAEVKEKPAGKEKPAARKKTVPKVTEKQAKPAAKKPVKKETAEKAKPAAKKAEPKSKPAAKKENKTSKK